MPYSHKNIKKHNLNQEAGKLQKLGPQKNLSEVLFYSEYSPKGLVRKGNATINDIDSLSNQGTISWLDVRSTGHLELLSSIGQKLDIHPIVLEDIQDPTKRPKMEDHDHYIFISLRTYRDQDNLLVSKQVSLILGYNYVITFQDGDDLFSQFRNRFDQKDSRLYRMGSDYLAYSLIDIVVDQFFPVVEKLSNKSEQINQLLIENFDEYLVKAIYELSQDISFIRKELLPINDIALKLRKYESRLLSSRVEPFMDDLYDHTLQNLESLTYQRENSRDLMDLYYSLSNSRMNIAMRTLTVVSTVFIPLTFIVGIYGMNFTNMPELNLRYGYYITMAVMLLIAIFIITIMKKKKWM